MKGDVRAPTSGELPPLSRELEQRANREEHAERGWVVAGAGRSPVVTVTASPIPPEDSARLRPAVGAVPVTTGLLGLGVRQTCINSGSSSSWPCFLEQRPQPDQASVSSSVNWEQ